MLDLNEFQTRKQKIDILLKEQGWDVGDRSKVVLEVDTKQSDFKKQDYKQVNETRKNDAESKYADYLLLGGTGKPLAIIEAKRTAKDPLSGQKQAEEYADDIKAQTGQDVFIFLSNGYEIRFWDRERYGVRQVQGFYSQKDLERLLYQKKNSEPEPEIDIDGSIVDRAKSIEVTTRVVEHMHKGHRKALIVMATGTGKTRVAMAIIDQLMREGRVQRVLFLTDRIPLRDQAIKKGFKSFFVEEGIQTKYFRNYDPNKRLYAYTIQAFQEIYTQKDRNGRYIISPGEFDLVFSDEAHRSIYSKWKGIFTYLDAVQIGLTATPADMVDRDTFRFFECEDGIPTALYSYEDAVRDGVLCDFRKNISGARTHFQIEGIKPRDLTEGEREELLKKGIDPDEINFEGSELEKKVAVKGTSEAIVREFMDNCLMDQTGNLPSKTIFFAISKTHAKRLWEAFEKLYPEYKGKLARIIVSDDMSAQKLIRSFEEESFPRIAISVDMMDTGIDVPEVCNLV
ncbi:MAG TPA: DEAD/DEAH box helicase family protein, partial [Methanosarcina sp.]|nr:DEAD/DEAH box helicase family protein [Methanosarcina sp.]